MTRIPLLALAALLAVLPACDCFNPKVGVIKVDTDCAGGSITHNQVEFAQLPGGLAQSQLEGLFPDQLKELAGQIACDQLLNPKSIGDLCAPLGVGGGLEPVKLDNATDTRVLMCGGQMFAVGGFQNGMFICKADQAVIDGQVWFVECQQFSASQTSPTGTCQGVVEFDQQIGL